jgi:GrpB-like predicted nucleotidyltransferase (UPF0157 family)
VSALNTGVTLVQSGPTWRNEFESIADRLRGALGDLALRIDHIGSTAVPGLAAKDVVDVQVTVDSLDPPAAILTRLRRTGLRVRDDIRADHRPPGVDGPDADWRKLYADGTSGRAVHVHVREAGRANQRYALLFRDYLQANRYAAEAYERAKTALAALCAETLTYAAAKDPVCDLVMIAAEKWAEATGWKPGDSDA